MNLQTVGMPPKYLLAVLNHLYEIERKLAVHGDAGNALRNVQRMRDEFAEHQQIFYEDPMGHRFDETRTDLEATITGERTDSLTVVEVIKPIIRVGTPAYSRIVQKGIVVVQAQSQTV